MYIYIHILFVGNPDTLQLFLLSSSSFPPSVTLDPRDSFHPYSTQISPSHTHTYPRMLFGSRHLLTSLLSVILCAVSANSFAPRPSFTTTARASSACLHAVASSSSSTMGVSTENLQLLSERGRKALLALIEHDSSTLAQTHVYGNWPEVGVDDEGKKQLTEQVSSSLVFW